MRGKIMPKLPVAFFYVSFTFGCSRYSFQKFKLSTVIDSKQKRNEKAFENRQYILEQFLFSTEFDRLCIFELAGLSNLWGIVDPTHGRLL